MVKAGYDSLRFTFSYGEGRIWPVKVYMNLFFVLDRDRLVDSVLSNFVGDISESIKRNGHTT